jgi:hypothetical protein
MPADGEHSQALFAPRRRKAALQAYLQECAEASYYSPCFLQAQTSADFDGALPQIVASREAQALLSIHTIRGARR